MSRHVLLALLAAWFAMSALADATLDALIAKAKAGDASAQFDLASLYVNGEGGVPQDNQKALEWYTRAAEQGDADAQYNLGVMYEHGIGVAKNWDKALAWYRKAGEQDDLDAQVRLADMYYRGEGVKQDDRQAYYWIYLAAAHPGVDPVAIRNRDLLGQKLGTEVTSEIEGRARKTVIQTLASKVTDKPTTTQAAPQVYAPPASSPSAAKPAAATASPPAQPTAAQPTPARPAATPEATPPEATAADAPAPSVGARLLSSLGLGKKNGEETPASPRPPEPEQPAPATADTAAPEAAPASTPVAKTPDAALASTGQSRSGKVTPVLPAGKPAAPTAKGNGRYVVQVASLESQAKADALSKKLKARGYNVFTRKGKGDKPTVQVLVGPLSGKDSAQQTKQAIDKALGVESLVTPFARQ